MLLTCTVIMVVILAPFWVPFLCMQTPGGQHLSRPTN